MNNLKFFKNDLKNHIEKNKALYIMLLFCFVLGIIIGFIIAVSNVSFLGLLNIKNKTFINYINGTVSVNLTFWNSLIQFLTPLIIVFLLSFNYYLNYLNFVMFIYQSTLLFLTCLSVIETYNFLGFLKIFFISIPINLLYFVVLMFWIVACYNRSREMHYYKNFSAGFNKIFYFRLCITTVMIILISVLVGFVIPLLLKTAIFLSF